MRIQNKCKYLWTINFDNNGAKAPLNGYDAPLSGYDAKAGKNPDKTVGAEGIRGQTDLKTTVMDN